MSKKNTLDAKRLRKANKKYDRGYPSFYEQDKTKPDEVMTMAKFMRLGFYSNVLNMLGLVKETPDVNTTAD